MRHFLAIIKEKYAFGEFFLILEKLFASVASNCTSSFNLSVHFYLTQMIFTSLMCKTNRQVIVQVLLTLSFIAIPK
jgi:hypothetical protein